MKWLVYLLTVLWMGVLPVWVITSQKDNLTIANWIFKSHRDTIEFGLPKYIIKNDPKALIHFFDSPRNPYTMFEVEDSSDYFFIKMSVKKNDAQIVNSWNQIISSYDKKQTGYFITGQ